MFVPSERLQYTISAKFRQYPFFAKIRAVAKLGLGAMYRVAPLHMQQFNQPEHDEQEDGQANEGNDGV